MNLTPAQIERLAWLSEEAGEVVQAIGKILHHGLDGTYDSGITNRAQLEIEIGHVICAADMLAEAGDISEDNAIVHCDVKRNSDKHMHFQT